MSWVILNVNCIESRSHLEIYLRDIRDPDSRDYLRGGIDETNPTDVDGMDGGVVSSIKRVLNSTDEARNPLELI